MNDETATTANVTECCGWPEMGVCSDCPDPEVVEWGKKNSPQAVSVCPGVTVVPITGTEESVRALCATLKDKGHD